MGAFITPNREKKILMTDVDPDSIFLVGSPLRTIISR
jgi:hypothetical protein